MIEPELSEVIWTASRADEGTISATGADRVATAVLESDWLAARDARMRGEPIASGSLTGFLIARIAEDEEQARADAADAMAGHRWKHAPQEVYDELQGVVLNWSRRVLAECDAKRRIVVSVQALLHDDGWEYGNVLALLALPYADHPDYREEWKP